jgi:hypothetical protein
LFVAIGRSRLGSPLARYISPVNIAVLIPGALGALFVVDSRVRGVRVDDVDHDDESVRGLVGLVKTAKTSVDDQFEGQSEFGWFLTTLGLDSRPFLCDTPSPRWGHGIRFDR